MSYPAIDRPNRGANGAQEQLRRYWTTHRQRLWTHRTAHNPSTPDPKTRACLPRPSRTARSVTTKRKTHVAGTPGKAFSRCLTDMAKLERLNQQPANGVQGRKQDARGRHARGRRSAPATSVTPSVTNRAPKALGALGGALRITSSDPACAPKVEASHKGAHADRQPCGHAFSSARAQLLARPTVSQWMALPMVRGRMTWWRRVQVLAPRGLRSRGDRCAPRGRAAREWLTIAWAGLATWLPTSTS